MTETPELKRALKRKRYRRWLISAVGLLVLVYFMLFRFAQVRHLAQLLEMINPAYFLLAVSFQALYFVLLAALFNELLRIFDHKLKLSFLIEHSLIFNFLNRVIPTAGVSGGSSLVSALRSQGVTGTHSGLITVTSYILQNASFMVLLAIGYAALFFRAELSIGAVRFTTFFVGAVILFVWTVLLVFGDKDKFHARSFALVRALNAVLRPIFKRTVIGTKGTKIFINDLFEGIRSIRAKRRELVQAAVMATGLHAAHLATLYVIFIGFGQQVNLAVLSVGYVLANIFSLLSFFISGLGVYEASMVSVLVGLGTPFEATLASVLVYRLLSFFAPLPIGFYLYRRS